VREQCDLSPLNPAARACHAETVQLFVGVWPPPKVRNVLSAYPRPKRDGLRWSTPSQWLITIRPLGHVADRIVPELVETLAAELDGAPRTKVSLGTPLHGEWLRSPVHGLDALLDVVFEVTEPLVPRTHPHNDWTAHLVLARGRSPKDLVAPLAASWTATSVSLAKATRSKEGPGYEDIATFPLGR
jgi:2'-5' RNA ligase